MTNVFTHATDLKMRDKFAQVSRLLATQVATHLLYDRILTGYQLHKLIERAKRCDGRTKTEARYDEDAHKQEQLHIVPFIACHAATTLFHAGDAISFMTLSSRRNNVDAAWLLSVFRNANSPSSCVA